MSVRVSLAIAVAAALAVPAVAGAVDYPPPSNPGGVSKPPPGPHHTWKVCKKGNGCIKRIQQAVDRAKAGDTIKVANGTYREGVIVKGAGKRYLKIVGNPKDPSKVVLEGKGAKVDQNAIQINGADQVAVDGIKAQHYKGNGFFAVNVNGYRLTHLIATLTGTYGIYAFNSKGGVMSDSEATWNNDGGFYIGQTIKQAKPIRSLVTRVRSYNNVIGFSGTNMRYVTITKSQFFNNGVGIVPNALDSEKYAPPEDNVITDNDVFWNNFDYLHGAPFKLRKPATGNVDYPPGIGIVLFGSRGTKVTNNRVYGNFLFGVGLIQQILLKQKDAQTLIGNEVSGNAFGLGGTDKNGRDLYYDGDGSGNCFANNSGVETTTPADGSTFAACPFSGPNAFSQDAQNQIVAWATADPTHEANWIRNAHADKQGYRALEQWRTGDPMDGYAPAK